jgi:hypothetical protein
MDKYKMFTNFMYNELGITKDDIRDWVKEAVYEVAEKYVQHEFSHQGFNDRVYQIIRDHRYMGAQGLDHKITQEVAALIAKELEIKLKEK